jgi:hypothetical protein
MHIDEMSFLPIITLSPSPLSVELLAYEILWSSFHLVIRDQNAELFQSYNGTILLFSTACTRGVELSVLERCWVILGGTEE